MNNVIVALDKDGVVRGWTELYDDRWVKDFIRYGFTIKRVDGPVTIGQKLTEPELTPPERVFAEAIQALQNKVEDLERWVSAGDLERQLTRDRIAALEMASPPIAPSGSVTWCQSISESIADVQKKVERLVVQPVKPLLPFTRAELEAQLNGRFTAISGRCGLTCSDFYFALESLVKEKQK